MNKKPITRELHIMRISDSGFFLQNAGLNELQTMHIYRIDAEREEDTLEAIFLTDANIDVVYIDNNTDYQLNYLDDMTDECECDLCRITISKLQ